MKYETTQFAGHFPLFKGVEQGVSSDMSLASVTVAQCRGLRVLQGLKGIYGGQI